MMKQALLVSLLAAALSVFSFSAVAEEQQQQQEQIYGYQLMTPQERAEYMHRLQTAKSEEEREQIRQEHIELMQSRAKERGVTLPDGTPMGNGVGPNGMQPGSGMGPGMGGGKR